MLRRTCRFFPFTDRDNHQYSLRLLTKGWPGWVGLLFLVVFLKILSVNLQANRFLSTVASVGGAGAYRPGGDARIKYLLWLNLERTLGKRRRKVGVVTRRQLKKVITYLHRATTKKVVSFFRKNRVTPSVAAPGDTNLSDATVCPVFQKWLNNNWHCELGYWNNLKWFNHGRPPAWARRGTRSPPPPLLEML